MAHAISTLTQYQRDAFQRAGVLRLEGLLPADVVQAARDVVLRQLEPVGLWKDGVWRLDAIPRPEWPEHGLKTSKVIGNRHPQLAALIEDPALLAVVSELLEGRAFARIGHNNRPHTLFTLPNTDTWVVPGGWHSDSPRLPSNQSEGVQAFTFLESVGRHGGGTLVISGSHRLLNQGRAILPRDFGRLLRDEPFFEGLFPTPAEANAPERAELLDRKGGADGVPLEILELTGAPGDVWLMDLRTMHAAAPNAADRPRLMVTFRYRRPDLAQEVADAWGWTLRADVTGR